MAVKANRGKFMVEEANPVGNKVGAYIHGHPLPVFPIYSTQKAWTAAGAA